MQTTLLAYQVRVNEARSMSQLRRVLAGMDQSLVAETLELVDTMSDNDFAEWRDGMDRCSATGDVPEGEWVDRYLDLIVPPPIARMTVFLTEEA